MKVRNKLITSITAAATLTALTLPVLAKDHALPDPDGKPADMSKPVQVYVLMGQSNMLGFGKISGGKLKSMVGKAAVHEQTLLQPPVRVQSHKHTGMSRHP